MSRHTPTARGETEPDGQLRAPAGRGPRFHVFQRERRGDPGRTPRQRGTQLPLAISGPDCNDTACPTDYLCISVSNIEGQAVLEDWTGQDQRPDFLRRGIAWCMPPNPVWDPGASARELGLTPKQLIIDLQH